MYKFECDAKLDSEILKSSKGLVAKPSSILGLGADVFLDGGADEIQDLERWEVVSCIHKKNRKKPGAGRGPSWPLHSRPAEPRFNNH